MFKKFIITFICIALAGCATTSGVNPDSLSKPSKLTEFTLDEDISELMVVTNALGSKTERISGLTKGLYVSIYEDDNGVFYKGPDNCVIQNKISGGIYLPKSNSVEKPAFWFYNRGLPESERAKAGIIVAIGDSWEEGRVRKDWWTTVSNGLLDAIIIKDSDK